jgi:hypothetical protein
MSDLIAYRLNVGATYIECDQFMNIFLKAHLQVSECDRTLVSNILPTYQSTRCHDPEEQIKIICYYYKLPIET